VILAAEYLYGSAAAGKLVLRRCLAVILTVTSLAYCATALSQPSSLNRVLFDPRPLDGSPLPVPVLAVPVPAMQPQTEVRDLGLDAQTVARYLDDIAAEELDEGPFAPDLMEQFLALGEAYQQGGNHEEALAAFEKADYISRINSGLHTPQQFTIVENMIASHLARGEVDEANSRQQYLLFLNRQYYGDGSLEVVPALATLGHWNLDAFRAMLNQRNASNLTIEHTAPRGINAPSPRLLAFANLYQARLNFYDAISNLLQHQRYDDPRLIGLERMLIETEFMAASREGIMHNPDFYMDMRGAYTGTRITRSRRSNQVNFINGRNAHERIRIYQEAMRMEPLEVAKTIISLADWHLLFDRQVGALDLYREASRYMREHGMDQARIDALLSPAIPQQLPVFTPLPHSRAKFGIAPDASVDYDGHIDVSFRVSRFGNAGRIEVVDQQGPVTADMLRRLRRLLNSTPFRPRFIAGEPATKDEVTVRYYFEQL
jgi:tetratricopeptide (TPR) repeat protein